MHTFYIEKPNDDIKQGNAARIIHKKQKSQHKKQKAKDKSCERMQIPPS